jgi:hypothetical protein
MWTDVVKDLHGKHGVYEADGVRTAVQVEEATAGSAFVRFRLLALEAVERFAVTGYIPQLKLGIDDVDSEVIIRQETGGWTLRFDSEFIRDVP